MLRVTPVPLERLAIGQLGVEGYVGRGISAREVDADLEMHEAGNAAVEPLEPCFDLAGVLGGGPAADSRRVQKTMCFTMLGAP